MLRGQKYSQGGLSVLAFMRLSGQRGSGEEVPGAAARALRAQLGFWGCCPHHSPCGCVLAAHASPVEPWVGVPVQHSAHRRMVGIDAGAATDTPQT